MQIWLSLLLSFGQYTEDIICSLAAPKIVPLLFYAQENSGQCSLRNSNFSHFAGRQGVGEQRTREHFVEVSLIPKKRRLGKKGKILCILSLSLKITLTIFL